jgi:hypothetical protein
MRKIRLQFALLIFVVVCAIAAFAQGVASEQIQGEIERLQKFAAAQQPDDQFWKDIKPGVDRFLTMADIARRAGHLLYAVEAISKANEYIVGYQSAKAAQAEKADRAAFDSRWKEISLVVSSLEADSSKRNWASTPAALRALSESGHGQGVPLLEGGRAFASLNDIVGGYFYIGQASGNQQSAKFAASVTVKRKGSPLPLRSILPELHALQEKTNAAFVPPRSIEKHPQFIRLNATLKTAFELDAGKLYAGALYQYLQAVALFEMLDAAAPEETKQTAIRDGISAAQQRVAKSTRDDSIAEMFVQRAETLLARKNGAHPTPDEWKNAAAVVDHVLPAYYGFLTAHPVPSKDQKPAVTVTLVRWPYT